MDKSSSDSTCSNTQPEPGMYKHYRGGMYEVLFVAKHTETLEDLVVYRALYDSPDMPTKLWVRPRTMFLEKVNFEGLPIPRFSRVDRT